MGIEAASLEEVLYFEQQLAMHDEAAAAGPAGLQQAKKNKKKSKVQSTAGGRVEKPKPKARPKAAGP